MTKFYRNSIFLRCMRVSTLVIGIQLITLSLLTAREVEGQSIRLNFKNASVITVLEAIEKQSDISFAFTKAELEDVPAITIRINGKNLNDVLKALKEIAPLEFKRKGNLIGVTVVEKPRFPQPKPIIDTPKQQETLQGRVTDTAGAPLPGVAVQVKGTSIGTYTDENGRYELADISDDAILVFTMLGFGIQEVPVDSRGTVDVVLRTSTDELSQVTVISTGYQEIAPERATGSFVHVNHGLINRRVSTNILDRLEGITSGLIFSSNIPSQSNESPISIRGRSTILANTQPLIVVDNFPYDGDLSNINPNDVESITVLRDAAAASIWGVRSGNGVIVITTKKGKINQPLTIELNSNITVGEKPDVFYNPEFLNASDYIDVELYLFERGYYNSHINDTRTRPVLSPVVEILAQQRAGTISASAAEALINDLRDKDFREDLSRYLYRNRVNQQYAINLKGGSAKATYLFSAGYDENLHSLVRNDYKRVTLNTFNTYSPVEDLHVTAGLSLAQSTTRNNNSGVPLPRNKISYYPYAQLADDKGNALALPKDYRYNFIDTAGGSNLLDWHYRPLDEMELSDNTSEDLYIRFNPGIRYSLTDGMSVELKYQYEKSVTTHRNLQSADTYYTRNLINLNTQPEGGSYAYPIPHGAILDRSRANLAGHTVRGQLNLNRSFTEKHSVDAIGGFEVKELTLHTDQSRLYGYEEEISANLPVNYEATYPKYANLANPGRIPYNDSERRTIDAYTSYFANAAYTYNKRYVVSASGRIDKSNLFGVNTNQKSVPLWSLGLAWNISEEEFYKTAWLPYLKLRATYGVNGNIDKSITAFTTAFYTNDPFTGAQSAIVLSPPNPELRWERIKTLNIGLSFDTRNRTFSGSIDYYTKRGMDLIGESALDPTTGFQEFRGNVANMKGRGLDISLHSRIVDRKFQWVNTLLVSSTSNEVTAYERVPILGTYLQTGAGMFGANISPIVGRPVYSISSFKWDGLDPVDGSPVGYLDGVPSTDYAGIYTQTEIEDLVYHGPARPTVFGALRNAFSYKNIALSVNVTYKLGYYFRRPSLDYGSFFGSWASHSDYLKRWQQPGDEQRTDVPSMVYPSNTLRNRVYTYSEALVEKGDHIRLQDVQLSYSLNNFALSQLPFSQLQIYLYANNLGLLWKANKADLDPDFVDNYSYPALRTVSLGVKAHF